MREFCTIRNSAIGSHSRVYERVSIKKAEIGSGVDINAGTYIEFATIEDGAQIGPNCSVVGVTHGLGEGGAQAEDKFERIMIGKRAWLGAGCIVLPGKTIGEGAVIGAGALVSKDVPPFYILMGVPPSQRLMSLKEWLARK